ncbi:DUF3306 domain-containing protein [Shewanella sp. Isolate8]|uniref:DUF3306 domain-containing protein n=1 Tax=Shewanella sp. Isolate8 TaxID=2908529 RepID=UPI001EFCBCEF|nr:DUF3306 domain-containing protein [Shewanella sp. Isolate8]MCG9748578.1 DUF3306 domain-containing protein [Shewanella sp. Isolate8]
MSDKPSGLFARWTQRRQQVQAEEEAARLAEQTEEQVAPPSVEAEGAEVNEPSDQASGEEKKILTAEDLPDPEKIEVGGSFASFMADNVDPEAKTAALRALWKQPHYNEIDGLLEYALDYTDQPKLTAEVSAELAKKVFRHLTKDEEAAEAGADAAETQLAQQENAAAQVEDNLDRASDEVPQNEPELQVSTKPPVV